MSLELQEDWELMVAMRVGQGQEEALERRVAMRVMKELDGHYWVFAAWEA